MIELQAPEELELGEEVQLDSDPTPEPPQQSRWSRLRARVWTKLRHPAILYGVPAIFLAVFIFLTIEYLHFARVADARLAEGPFSSSTNILAASETISKGAPLKPDELTAKLDRAGYTRSSGNPDGWYEVGSRGITIHPGPNASDETVTVTFAPGKVAAITAVAGNAARESYKLNPPLLTNLSGNREKRRLVQFADIPQSLIQAVTSAEDKRFFSHNGFDYRRMIKAAYVDFKDGHKQQGASTLTMQLARALWLDPAKRWKRKFQESMITMHLEHKLSKQQIFEDYVNEVYLGRRGTYSINGMGEAARVYFGKELRQIEPAEAAFLAGLIQRPSYYNPFRYPERAIARRNLVLGLMKRNGALTDSQYRSALAAPLKLAPSTQEGESSFFISMMNDELQSDLGDSAKQAHFVATTIVPDLQKAAEAAVASGMAFVDQQLKRQIAADGVRPQVALVALDPHTGEIKAVVGGRNYGDSQLNHALAMRQPGSVFKPFVYAAAINTAIEGGSQTFTPATILNDEATTFAFGNQEYEPRNFHNEFRGQVTLREALAFSLNVPTVSLAEQVGYRRVVAMARRAGLNDEIKATPAVALGAYETTPLEIAAAYTMFANGGTWVKPTTLSEVRSTDGTVMIHRQPELHPAIDPRVAYVTLNMMEEVLWSGTGAGVRARGFQLPAAGKTGTSHDGWFAGFTPDLLCVVWVGFDDNRELNLEGAKSALPIWTEFMKRAAHMKLYSSGKDFKAPSGIASASICNESGKLAGALCSKVHNEVFIAGTEPTDYCDGHSTIGGSDIGMPIH